MSTREMSVWALLKRPAAVAKKLTLCQLLLSLLLFWYQRTADLVLRFWCFYMTLCYHSQYMELFRVMWQGFLLSVMPFKLVQCQCLCFTFLHPCTRYKLTTLTFCESDVNKLATWSGFNRDAAGWPAAGRGWPASQFICAHLQCLVKGCH